MRSSGSTVSVRLLVALVVGAFLLGLAAKTLLLRDGTVTTRDTPRSADALADDVRSRSRDGARAAAIAFVQMGDELLATDRTDAANRLARVASRHSRDEFVRTELAGFEQLRSALGRGDGPIRLRVGV